MPDLLLYLQVLGITSSVSAIVVLTLLRMLRPQRAGLLQLIPLLGLLCGLLLGYHWLHLRWSWPPVNALDRWLTLVLPAACVIELIAACQWLRSRWLWLLRFALAALTARVLLHGSVYLATEKSGPWPVILLLCLSGVVLATGLTLLLKLARRPASSSLLVVVGSTLMAAGMTILLAGYVSGGAAVLPLAAALVGLAIAACLTRHQLDLTGALSAGLVGLFGLLFIGCYFGGLSTPCALTLWFVPVLSWGTEVPPLVRLGPWWKGICRLGFVAIPLAVIVGAAKLDFDRDSAPLIEGRAIRFTSTPSQQSFEEARRGWCRGQVASAGQFP